MQRIVNTFIVLAAVLFGASATLAQTGAPAAGAGALTTFKLGRKGVFNVDMPAKPEAESLPLRTGGYDIKATMYTSSNDEVFVAVGDVYDLPFKNGQIPKAMQDELFKSVRDGIVEGIEAELSKSGIDLPIKFGPIKAVSLSDSTGLEQRMDVGPFPGRARLLTADGHVFIFLAIAFDKNKSSLMDGFLDSFEYIGNTN